MGYVSKATMELQYLKYDYLNYTSDELPRWTVLVLYALHFQSCLQRLSRMYVAMSSANEKQCLPE